MANAVTETGRTISPAALMGDCAGAFVWFNGWKFIGQGMNNVLMGAISTLYHGAIAAEQAAVSAFNHIIGGNDDRRADDRRAAGAASSSAAAAAEVDHTAQAKTSAKILALGVCQLVAGIGLRYSGERLMSPSVHEFVGNLGTRVKIS